MIDPLITGLFGGAGVTLLWELVLRPARQRRGIAEVLAAEVSINLQLLAAARHYASPRKVAPDLSLSTNVFTSITDKIGELPPVLVGEVVFLYKYFDELNQHPRVYVELVKELRGCERGSARYQEIEKDILACVAVFNSYVENAIHRVNLVQPLLLKAAFPLWSPRRWSRTPAKLLDTDELAARIEQSESKRRALASQIQGRAVDE